MHNNSASERVQQFREHFGLSRKDFSHEINMSLANVYRIETGVLEPSDAFLNAIIVRFAANPDWIKSGEGDMLLAPEEYIAKGIALLGVEQFSKGLTKVLEDPQFAELRALVAAQELVTEQIDPNLMAYARYILTLGQQGDEKMKIWLMVQLEKAFPEVEGKKD